jgi:UDP-N-acetylmuramate dehydrogenase
VARVALAFERGETGAVRDELQGRLVRRKRTQPLQLPNAGSCFRNPVGDKAGRLIEAAGAKGWREGGAEVSDVHANFIVNRGDATAADVASLLARVRRAVLDRFGVELELEVHFIGVFA